MPTNRSIAFRRWRRRLVGNAWERVLRLAWLDVRIRHVGLRSLFGQHFVPGTLAMIPFADHRLLVDPSDAKIGLRLLHGKSWNRTELEQSFALLEKNGSLTRGGVFVDVGANIGAVTVYALKSGYFASAVAFEPDPHNFSILEQNMALNGLTGRVTLVMAAVGDAAGSALLQRDQRNLGAHTIHAISVPTPEQTVLVQQDRLDSWLDRLAIPKSSIGFVKIDVEGHELEVLEGAIVLRQQSVPILFEYLGVHHGAAGGARLKKLLAGCYDQAHAVSTQQPLVKEGATGIEALDTNQDEADILAYRRGSTMTPSAKAA
jgi:FkbM family methyltransferase